MTVVLNKFFSILLVHFFLIFSLKMKERAEVNYERKLGLGKEALGEVGGEGGGGR